MEGDDPPAVRAMHLADLYLVAPPIPRRRQLSASTGGVLPRTRTTTTKARPSPFSPRPPQSLRWVRLGEYRWFRAGRVKSGTAAFGDSNSIIIARHHCCEAQWKEGTVMSHLCGVSE